MVRIPEKYEGAPVDSRSMTVHDVAGYLNVDEKTVYRLAQRGQLPGFKVAGTWRFKRDDIEMWIEQRKVRPADKKNGNESVAG